MAKKPTSRARPAARAPNGERAAVSPDRFARLCRLLRALAGGPHSRAQLARRLRLDVRGFYRDLELVRSAGISVSVSGGRYALGVGLEEALDRLPFPDPRLTLGEALALARGRTQAPRRRGELTARPRT